MSLFRDPRVGGDLAFGPVQVLMLDLLVEEKALPGLGFLQLAQNVTQETG